MDNLIYEYVPSENIVKVSVNDFKTLLKIKDNYEKLINQVPNNVLQQRIDKAIEYINNYMPNYDFDHYNLAKLLDILRGKDNE